MNPVALFQEYTCAKDYEDAGIKAISPMLAKELEEEEKQNACLSSPYYYVEEKFDGTRATLHFFEEFTRCFSRRVSEKTGWFCENSDSVPHIRDIAIPELAGTIIDGEMFIPNRPFKDVSSTLNCKWDKAVARQEEIGKIVFHAFDIMYYKGIRVELFPLHKRKKYLQEVIDTVNSKYVEMVAYHSCGGLIAVNSYVSTHGDPMKLLEKGKIDSYPALKQDLISQYGGFHTLTPRGFYEYIVATGGEGVIVKPKNGKYYYKRGWEYSKIKKFLTREVIIMGFSDPTDDYKGKFPTIDKWDYWESDTHEIYDMTVMTPMEKVEFAKYFDVKKYRPVSKFYAKRWVGNIRFGVIITPEEMHSLPKNKKFHIEDMIIAGDDVLVLEVGECSGFDEETREWLTERKHNLKGHVIEVKANEIFKDTGKLRHPRFLRFRTDKSPTSCTLKEHLNA